MNSLLLSQWLSLCVWVPPVGSVGVEKWVVVAMSVVGEGCDGSEEFVGLEVVNCVGVEVVRDRGCRGGLLLWGVRFLVVVWVLKKAGLLGIEGGVKCCCEWVVGRSCSEEVLMAVSWMK